MIVSVLTSLQYNGQQSIEPAVSGWTEWFWTQVTRVGSHVDMCHVFKNRAQFVLKCELGTKQLICQWYEGMYLRGFVAMHVWMLVAGANKVEGTMS